MIDLLKEIEKFVILLEYSYSDCILLFFFQSVTCLKVSKMMLPSH